MFVNLSAVETFIFLKFNLLPRIAAILKLSRCNKFHFSLELSMELESKSDDLCMTQAQAIVLICWLVHVHSEGSEAAGDSACHRLQQRCTQGENGQNVGEINTSGAPALRRRL